MNDIEKRRIGRRDGRALWVGSERLCFCKWIRDWDRLSKGTFLQVTFHHTRNGMVAILVEAELSKLFLTRCYHDVNRDCLRRNSLPAARNPYFKFINPPGVWLAIILTDCTLAGRGSAKPLRDDRFFLPGERLKGMWTEYANESNYL